MKLRGADQTAPLAGDLVTDRGGRARLRDRGCKLEVKYFNRATAIRIAIHLCAGPKVL